MLHVGKPCLKVNLVSYQLYLVCRCFQWDKSGMLFLRLIGIYTMLLMTFSFACCLRTAEAVFHLQQALRLFWAVLPGAGPESTV